MCSVSGRSSSTDDAYVRSHICLCVCLTLLSGEMLLALGQTDEAVRMLRESLSIYQEIASGEWASLMREEMCHTCT